MDAKKLTVLGGLTIVGLSIAALTFGRKTIETFLNISAGTGGTTDPTPSLYSYLRPENVVIRAIPDTGYYFNGWIVDGSSQGLSETITVNMNEDHDVVATFSSTEPDPGRVPVDIICLTAPPPASLSLNQKYKGNWYNLEPETGEPYRRYEVYPIIEDYQNEWTPAYNYKFMEFQVLDLFGQPCADIPFLLYSNEMPDYNKGKLHLRDFIHEDWNPLFAASNGDGIVTVRLNYLAENQDDFARKHIAYGKQWWFSSYTGACLADGDVHKKCGQDPGCTAENTITTLDCPGCIPQCQEISEYETAPITNIVTAEYRDNPTVSTFAYVSCWLGIKHVTGYPP